MSDIVEFIKARMSEDYTRADDASQHLVDGADLGFNIYELPEPIRRHVLRWVPARVFDEVDAKNRIIAEAIARHRVLTDGGDCSGSHTLRVLASVYSDHPDYDENWSPVRREPIRQPWWKRLRSLR